MALKAVPKPDGHELRLKRACRNEDASKWLPEDALYDAYEGLKTTSAEAAMIVAWYTRLPDGNLSIKYRCYSEHDRQHVALASDLLASLQT